MTESANGRAQLLAQVAAAEGVLGRLLAAEECGPLLRSTLTMPQLKLLTVLRLDGPSGGRELAGRLGVSMPTISGMVDRLVARGLVERGVATTDRRVRPVALSAAGEEVLREVERHGQAFNRDLLADLDLEDLRALVRGVCAVAAAAERRLARRTEELKGEPGSGECAG